MDGQSDAIRFLKSLTSFSGLQSATVKTIASRCRLRPRQAGEDLFLEGDPCRASISDLKALEGFLRALEHES